MASPREKLCEMQTKALQRRGREKRAKEKSQEGSCSERREEENDDGLILRKEWKEGGSGTGQEAPACLTRASVLSGVAASVLGACTRQGPVP